GQRPHIKEISSQFKKELKKDVDKGWGVLVRLLAGRPGGRPRARAPAPHRSTERGLPESSRYPNRGNQSWLASVAPPYRGAVTPVGAGASSNRAMRAPGVRPTMRTVWLPAPRYGGFASFSVVQEVSGPSWEGWAAGFLDHRKA